MTKDKSKNETEDRRPKTREELDVGLERLKVLNR
jgi:hypothetical protein